MGADGARQISRKYRQPPPVYTRPGILAAWLWWLALAMETVPQRNINATWRARG